MIKKFKQMFEEMELNFLFLFVKYSYVFYILLFSSSCFFLLLISGIVLHLNL